MTALSIRPAETAEDWRAVEAIREAVFVVEQACPPELEWDDHDAPALRGETVHHLVGWEGTEALAVMRWREAMLDGQRAAKIERVAVRRDARGRGLARQVVERALRDARAAGHHQFVLHAQRYLTGFYASMGFEVLGEPFVEAGIEHVKMTLTDR